MVSSQLYNLFTVEPLTNVGHAFVCVTEVNSLGLLFCGLTGLDLLRLVNLAARYPKYSPTQTPAYIRNMIRIGLSLSRTRREKTGTILRTYGRIEEAVCVCGGGKVTTGCGPVDVFPSCRVLR